MKNQIRKSIEALRGVLDARGIPNVMSRRADPRTLKWADPDGEPVQISAESYGHGLSTDLKLIRWRLPDDSELTTLGLESEDRRLRGWLVDLAEARACGTLDPTEPDVKWWPEEVYGWSLRANGVYVPAWIAHHGEAFPKSRHDPFVARKR